MKITQFPCKPYIHITEDISRTTRTEVINEEGKIISKGFDITSDKVDRRIDGVTGTVLNLVG